MTYYLLQDTQGSDGAVGLLLQPMRCNRAMIPNMMAKRFHGFITALLLCLIEEHYRTKMKTSAMMRAQRIQVFMVALPFKEAESIDYVRIPDRGDKKESEWPGLDITTPTVYDTTMKYIYIVLLETLLAATGFAQLRITCFDVGQGNGAYLQSPSGMNAVIDAGPSNTVGRRMWAFMRDSMHVRHLDYTFLSHYHLDHIDGMDRIIDSVNVYPDSFRVGAYDRGYSYASAAYDEYALSAGAKRFTATIGQTFDLGSGVTTQCISSNGKTLSGDSILPGSEENNKSMGILLTYGTFKMVFATDIAGYNSSSYKDVESILAPDIGPVSVMIVNHHGSATSSNPTWVSTLNPKASIISIGQNNTYPHPTQEAIDRLCSNSSTYIYQTENTPTGGGTIPAGRGRVTNSNIHIIVGDTSFTVAGDHYSLPITGVESISMAQNPAVFFLSIPYPNPTKAQTAIVYQLSKPDDIDLSVYNINGQRIRQLIAGQRQPGHYIAQWDGKDSYGKNVTSGIYFYRLTDGKRSTTAKLLITR